MHLAHEQAVGHVHRNFLRASMLPFRIERYYLCPKQTKLQISSCPRSAVPKKISACHKISFRNSTLVQVNRGKNMRVTSTKRDILNWAWIRFDQITKQVSAEELLWSFSICGPRSLILNGVHHARTARIRNFKHHPAQRGNRRETLESRPIIIDLCLILY